MSVCSHLYLNNLPYFSLFISKCATSMDTYYVPLTLIWMLLLKYVSIYMSRKIMRYCYITIYLCCILFTCENKDCINCINHHYCIKSDIMSSCYLNARQCGSTEGCRAGAATQTSPQKPACLGPCGRCPLRACRHCVWANLMQPCTHLRLSPPERQWMH